MNLTRGAHYSSCRQWASLKVDDGRSWLGGICFRFGVLSDNEFFQKCNRMPSRLFFDEVSMPERIGQVVLLVKGHARIECTPNRSTSSEGIATG